jgi:hypothetical protein
VVAQELTLLVQHLQVQEIKEGLEVLAVVEEQLQTMHQAVKVEPLHLVKVLEEEMAQILAQVQVTM